MSETTQRGWIWIQDEESCMAIAGTLHFFFLVECFFFMAIAVDIFLPDTLGIPWFLLLVGLPWVASVFLVAVAIGSFTQEEYLGENIASKRQKFKTWVTEHKHLLEFGLGITLMSSQVLISLFADDDKGVKDVSFGLFTFAKDEDKKKFEEDKKAQEQDTISADSTDDNKNEDDDKTPEQERRNKDKVVQVFENPTYTQAEQKDDIIDGKQTKKKKKKQNEKDEDVYQNTDSKDSDSQKEDSDGSNSVRQSDEHTSQQKPHKKETDQSQKNNRTGDDAGQNEVTAVSGSQDNDNEQNNVDETGEQKQNSEPVYQNIVVMINSEDCEDTDEDDKNSDHSDEILSNSPRDQITERQNGESVGDNACELKQDSNSNDDNKHQRETSDGERDTDSSQNVELPDAIAENHQQNATGERSEADQQPLIHTQHDVNVPDPNSIVQGQSGESNDQNNDSSNYYEQFSTQCDENQHQYEDFRPHGGQTQVDHVTPEVNSEV